MDPVLPGCEVSTTGNPASCHGPVQSGGGGSRGLTDSMLHDGAKEGRVAVRGKVNGTAFQVERAVKVGALCESCVCVRESCVTHCVVGWV